MATVIGPNRVRLGPCMAPAYAEGAELDIVPAPAVHSGMVALLRAGDGLVLHRILDVVPPWVVHAGDAVPTPGLARIDDVVGMPAVRAIEIGGASMTPTIRRGDVVPVEAAEVRNGDVALLWTREGPLVHRILDRAGDWVVHAGDASGAMGIASRRQIVGRIPVPRAARTARAMGLLLRLALPLHAVGIPSNALVRACWRGVRNLLQAVFAPPRMPVTQLYR